MKKYKQFLNENDNSVPYHVPKTLDQLSFSHKSFYLLMDSDRRFVFGHNTERVFILEDLDSNELMGYSASDTTGDYKMDQEKDAWLNWIKDDQDDFYGTNIEVAAAMEDLYGVDDNNFPLFNTDGLHWVEFIYGVMPVNNEDPNV